MICVCAAVCALASPLAAQTLRGTVRDSSGATVANARVTLQQSGRRDELITGRDGEFRFNQVAPGAKIEVTADGFQPFSQTVANPDATVDVVLRVLPLAQEIVVTPQRSAVAIGETDAAVVRFGADALHDSGAPTLDDKLRQAPGFSLLRRTSSRAANPTTQGASVRGLAASGASRVLVLDDGVPLNDPFGGWIYWDRVPAVSIDSVEVMESGGSHLYGSGALGGVVNVLPSHPGNSLAADVSIGNETSPQGSLLVAHDFSGWVLSAAAEGFRTDGYVALRPPDRGAVDVPITLRYGTGIGRVEHRLRHGTVFASESLFNEGRGNGTPAQQNSTRLMEFRAGADLDAGSGRFSLRAFAGQQSYAQTFSSIVADRSRETLTTWQRVPAQQEGGEVQWNGIAAGGQTIAAGIGWREMRGISNEVGFSRGIATPSSAGGNQSLPGAFVSDSIRFRRLTVTAGARLDRWSNRPLTASGDRSGADFSPHAGVVVPIAGGVSWSASVYRSFRAPTLNELYRNFRVGNVFTLANPALGPERLAGGETGVGFGKNDVRARATFFWEQVSDPVANLTLSTTPALITRQRQNLGSLRSRGLELSLESRLPHHLSLRAAYQFVDATVLSSPGNPALVGLSIPQAPRHAATFAAAFVHPKWTASLQGRALSRQFDDDLNQFPLDPMFDLGLFAARRVSSSLEFYVAAENALGQRAMVGRTPTPTWGTPALVRVGARISLRGKK